MVLLFSLSGSFIILWLTNVVDFVYYQITGSGTDRNVQQFIFNYAGHLLRNFSCCTNTFIYMATQCKFRDEVRSGLKYPFTRFLQFINKAAS